MVQTTTLRQSRKGFPLTERSDGRYQKKVRGKTFYFTGTRQEALDEWLRVKDDLLAGHDPQERTCALTLRDLFNRFLTAKKDAVETGELTQRSWNDYKDMLGTISNSTLRRMLAKGEIPKPIRIGRQLRWRAADLREWLAALS